MSYPICIKKEINKCPNCEILESKLEGYKNKLRIKERLLNMYRKSKNIDKVYPQDGFKPIDDFEMEQMK
jgi:hypothetical protein